MTGKQIQAAANRNLSNYDGERYSNMAGLTTLADTNGKNVSKIAVFQVKNIDTANTNTVRLTYAANLAGVVIGPDGPSQNGCIQTATGSNAFNSIEGNKSLQAVSLNSDSTIEEVIAFVHKNPTTFTVLQVVSTSTAQLGLGMTIVKKRPFKNDERRFIPFTITRSPQNFDNTTFEIVLNEQLDDQTEIEVAIPAGQTSTFTMYLGGSLNFAKEMAVASEVGNLKRLG